MKRNFKKKPQINVWQNDNQKVKVYKNNSAITSEWEGRSKKSRFCVSRWISATELGSERIGNLQESSEKFQKMGTRWEGTKEGGCKIGGTRAEDQSEDEEVIEKWRIFNWRKGDQTTGLSNAKRCNQRRYTYKVY